jgi:hypothetical protein
MLSVPAEDVTPENILKWKNLGYSFIVLHDYESYPAYFSKVKPDYSLDFLTTYKELVIMPEFKIYFFQ